MDFIEYSDADMMMLSLARILSRDLREALLRRDRALFAVPGGTTPGPVFDMLSAVDIDWDRVDVVPGDERWLPEDHPRSNAGQLRARLLRGKASAAHLLPLWRDLPPAEGAALTAADLEPLLPIDVALVGMGADMHTASMFPGAPELALALANDAPVIVPITAPDAPEPRVTMSARVLKGAFALHVLIVGAEKREALERAQKLSPTEAPINALLSKASVHWAP
ncbi:6-phosphogluconolactonase [Pararhodobacter aggregans]|uniref:6-phosphogluconolactonase n=1 Tax=Pararhodobacter aggregans TaxID=404875 RepID=A0A2T7UPS0_9RHOB|nr:6-phosphogluconolactonase [Pararhodobacter aggregans]PTX01290.1 6-phosphogluconolactonase [Pararhodobacter aggregans]PVE46667.1 6-phosphogluconolactonase [Pararhodobacter aggregans]